MEAGPGGLRRERAQSPCRGMRGRLGCLRGVSVGQSPELGIPQGSVCCDVGDGRYLSHQPTWLAVPPSISSFLHPSLHPSLCCSLPPSIPSPLPHPFIPLFSHLSLPSALHLSA